MNKSLKSSLLAAAAVGLLGTVTASAAVVSGHISHIDRPAHKLVLHHHVYHLTDKLPAAGLHKGEHVTLTYHWSHGQRWATAVRPITAEMAAAHHKPVKHTSMLTKSSIPAKA